MQATLRLYSLDYRHAKTYGVAALFALGNIVFPQLCHLVHLGGPTWLPIYFFTLVGAYKYGWKAGLLTAVASPVVNSLLFGMPATAELPAILLKSVLLAVFAGLPLPQSHLAPALGRSAGLSSGRHHGRMVPVGQLLPGHTGLPHRHPRHVGASARRLAVAELCGKEAAASS